MNVREMHIEFDQSTQQVASNRTRKYLPEEKDWILTKMQERLIQGSISPKKDGSGGFEVNQLYADRIRTLIVSSTMLVPYIDAGQDRYKAYLPADYSYLLSDWSYTSILCGGVSPQTGSQSLNLYALRQNLSKKVAPPFYQTMSVGFPKQVNIPGDLNFINDYKGYPKAHDVSFLTPLVAQVGGYYWERYGDIVKPNCYLYPTTETISPQLHVDGNDETSVTVQQLDLTYHVGQGVRTSNRLMPSNKIPFTRDTAFYKTAHYSPISELAGNLLYVYSDNSFIVTQVGVTYIRKCAPISLSLGSNSELPEQFHQQICDLAVEYVKGRLGDVQGMQLAENDNNNRVTL